MRVRKVALICDGTDVSGKRGRCSQDSTHKDVGGPNTAGEHRGSQSTELQGEELDSLPRDVSWKREVSDEVPRRDLRSKRIIPSPVALRKRNDKYW